MCSRKPDLHSVRNFALLAVLLLFPGTPACSWKVNGDNFKLRSSERKPEEPSRRWHRNVLATCFWVGEPGNESSAWDPRWQEHFGGVDDPRNRRGWQPAGFTPAQNTFYCALPYNDVAGLPNARSEMRGRWVEVLAGGKSCFCRWEDVGPWYVDDRDYVLGPARPRAEREGKAGIDLSPAVRDYLGLSGKDPVNWRFVEKAPSGPWNTPDELAAGPGTR